MDERKHKGTCWGTGNALFLIAHICTFMKIHQAYDMCTFLNVSYTPIKMAVHIIDVRIYL